jgi:uncharacterized RmlC-like cupin family protein
VSDARSGVRIIRPDERDPGTAQTPGMTRLAGVAASTCGASGVWMGEVSNGPSFRSAAHHHGDVESAIYILNGRMRYRWGARLEESADAGAGDFVFVPANVVHQEINLSDSEALVAIVARGGDNIVVNVELPEAAL